MNHFGLKAPAVYYTALQVLCAVCTHISFHRGRKNMSGSIEKMIRYQNLSWYRTGVKLLMAVTIHLLLCILRYIYHWAWVSLLEVLILKPIWIWHSEVVPSHFYHRKERLAKGRRPPVRVLEKCPRQRKPNLAGSVPMLLVQRRPWSKLVSQQCLICPPVPLHKELLLQRW